MDKSVTRQRIPELCGNDYGMTDIRSICVKV